MAGLNLSHFAGQILIYNISKLWAAMVHMVHLLPNKHQLISWLCNDVQCKLPCPGGLLTCSIPINSQSETMAHHQPSKSVCKKVGLIQHGWQAIPGQPFLDVIWGGFESWPTVMFFFLERSEWHSFGTNIYKKSFSISIDLVQSAFLVDSPSSLVRSQFCLIKSSGYHFGQLPDCPRQVRCLLRGTGRERPVRCPLAYRLVMTCHDQLLPKKSHHKYN